MDKPIRALGVLSKDGELLPCALPDDAEMVVIGRSMERVPVVILPADKYDALVEASRDAVKNGGAFTETITGDLRKANIMAALRGLGEME